MSYSPKVDIKPSQETNKSKKTDSEKDNEKDNKNEDPTANIVIQCVDPLPIREPNKPATIAANTGSNTIARCML